MSELKKMKVCRTCEHCIRTTWMGTGSGKIYFYCRKHPSNRTWNKKMKIKSNQIACSEFEEKIKDNTVL